jgi:hypothetical protein
MIYNDRKAGSWLSPLNIITSGNISIIELKHFNSQEHPDHCPDRSVMVIHRTKDKVSTLQLQIFKSIKKIFHPIELSLETESP